MKIFINGKYVDIKDARVSFIDRGFLYGDGAFETMRAYDGKVFCLDEHMKRLFKTLKDLAIKVKYTEHKMAELVRRAVKLNKLKSAYVKVIVTRGVTSGSIDVTSGKMPTIIIYAAKLSRHDEKIYDKGVKACFSSITRNKASFIVNVKSLNYVDNIMARYEARKKGFYEAIFINTNGYVTEAASSNIFIVKNGKVFTPARAAGLLGGITRTVVMDILKDYFKAGSVERLITPAELMNADEVFLTNSVSEIIPVVGVGKKKIGKGLPGPAYRVVRALYKKEVNA